MSGHGPERDVYLVRVSRELVDELVADDSKPVVVLRVVDLGDGSFEMVVRSADPAFRA